MALRLATNFKGVGCNYWKIISKWEYVLSNQTKVVVALYLNKEQRDLNSDEFMLTKEFSLEGVDLVRKDIYTKLKENSIFTNAIDC